MRNGSPSAAKVSSPVGRFHCWWRGDPIPALPSLPGLSIEPTDNQQLLGDLTTTDPRIIDSQIERGHQPWLARIVGKPVAWGWIAGNELSIGELGISRQLPPANRYLWGFFTMPEWRGRGIYPRMLQTIIANEPEAARFWIGHDLDNTASERGIAKAGFLEVGPLYRVRDGAFELVPMCPLPRATAAAKLFGVRIAGQQQEERARPRGATSSHEHGRVLH